jgi:hypothetical protein
MSVGFDKTHPSKPWLVRTNVGGMKVHVGRYRTRGEAELANVNTMLKRGCPRVRPWPRRRKPDPVRLAARRAERRKALGMDPREPCGDEF